MQRQAGRFERGCADGGEQHGARRGNSIKAGQLEGWCVVTCGLVSLCSGRCPGRKHTEHQLDGSHKSTA